MLLSMTFIYFLATFTVTVTDLLICLACGENFSLFSFLSAQKVEEFFKLVEGLGLSSLVILSNALCTDQIKTSKSPFTRHLYFWRLDCSNSCPFGLKCSNLFVGLSFVCQVTLLKNHHCLFLLSVITLCLFMMRGDINSRRKAILGVGYTVYGMS